MADVINMIDLVAELLIRPRGRACIVLTEDYEAQKEWGARLAQLTSVHHLDVLEEFSATSVLSQSLSSVSVSTFFDHLRGMDQFPVLIVTGMDFLIATWVGNPNALEQMAQQVETWEKQPALLLVMQYSEIIASRQFSRFPERTFVVAQKDTLKLT